MYDDMQICGQERCGYRACGFLISGHWVFFHEFLFSHPMPLSIGYSFHGFADVSNNGV